MLIAMQIDVVVVVIDRVHENTVFVHFVGMPIAPCFKVSASSRRQRIDQHPSGGAFPRLQIRRKPDSRALQYKGPVSSNPA